MIKIEHCEMNKSGKICKNNRYLPTCKADENNTIVADNITKSGKSFVAECSVNLSQIFENLQRNSPLGSKEVRKLL